jgi:hypothetical protein
MNKNNTNTPEYSTDNDESPKSSSMRKNKGLRNKVDYTKFQEDGPKRLKTYGKTLQTIINHLNNQIATHCNASFHLMCYQHEVKDKLIIESQGVLVDVMERVITESDVGKRAIDVIITNAYKETDDLTVSSSNSKSPVSKTHVTNPVIFKKPKRKIEVPPIPIIEDQTELAKRIDTSVFLDEISDLYEPNLQINTQEAKKKYEEFEKKKKWNQNWKERQKQTQKEQPKKKARKEKTLYSKVLDIDNMGNSPEQHVAYMKARSEKNRKEIEEEKGCDDDDDVPIFINGKAY